MATVASPPSTDQAADLLQKLSLDAQSKPVEIPEPTKKPSANQYGSIDSGNAAIGQIPNERSVTPFLQDFMDPTMCYLHNGYQSYYYGGYDGTGNDWDEYSRYTNSEGVDMTSGVYGDNGSLVYHHGYGYGPYGPYSPAASPVPSMGNDGQLYGPQHYQYPPYFQPLNPTSGPYTPTPAAGPQSQGDISTAAATEQKPLSVETANPNGNGLANGGGTKGNNGAAPLKSTYQNSAYGSNVSYGRGALPGHIPSSGYQDPRYGFDGLRSSYPWSDGPLYSDGQSRLVSSSTITSSIANGNNISSSRNPSYRPNTHYVGFPHPRPMSGMSTTQGFMNRMYPNKLYGQYGNAVRSSVGYASHGYDSRSNGRVWLAVDNKYKPRGRNGAFYGYGNENMDGLNELNRGPRAKGGKNQKGFTPSVLAVKGQFLPTNVAEDEEKDKLSTPDRDQYNKSDFPEDYPEAKFFVIKSYSEDDVHKSIKYNVWASTPNGNKKLDAAYQEAQEKPGGCPIFLLFSVNTSGQFVGLAEMVGPVDFQKNLEYWQQDKWNGCFPVKWHVVKDVPNSLLKHIILENNENKPVTNSRDTQEIKLEPGLKLVKIFKEHASKTCILDDFGFYEARQKTIQEKKAKQQQFKKQVWEGKPTDEKKEGSDIDLNSTSNHLQFSLSLSMAMFPAFSLSSVQTTDASSSSSFSTPSFSHFSKLSLSISSSSSSLSVSQSSFRRYRLRSSCVFGDIHSRRIPKLKGLKVNCANGEPLKVMISGAPASGKGTQCELIVQKFGLVHISTGDLLRAEISAGTEIGNKAKEYMNSGRLVPDEVVTAMVTARLSHEDATKKGWLLDGYPRTLLQAESLEKLQIRPDVYLVLDVPDEILIDRCIGRRLDPETRKIYHLKNFPPETEEIKARLLTRPDDTEEKVKSRLEIYKRNAEAVASVYLNITKKIDGSRSREEIFEEIASILFQTQKDKVTKLGKPAFGFESTPSHQDNWRGIPTRLNNIPHSREIRQYFYNDVLQSTKQSVKNGGTRLKVEINIPELNPEMDVYRIGTLMELIRAIALSFADDGKRVKVCIQGSMGEGALSGMPLQLAGTRKILEFMDWGDYGALGTFIKIGSIGAKEVDEQDDMFILVAPQNAVGNCIIDDMKAMTDAAGDRPVILVNPRLKDLPGSSGIMQTMGRDKRLEYAASFQICYFFRLLYYAGTQYPIMGALRMAYPYRYELYKRVDESFGKEKYVILSTFPDRPSTDDINNSFQGKPRNEVNKSSGFWGFLSGIF